MNILYFISLILLSSCYKANEQDLNEALLTHESRHPLKHLCDVGSPSKPDPIRVSIDLWTADF